MGVGLLSVPSDALKSLFSSSFSIDFRKTEPGDERGLFSAKFLIGILFRKFDWGLCSFCLIFPFFFMTVYLSSALDLA